jgi:hypothetical protein
MATAMPSVTTSHIVGGRKPALTAAIDSAP